MSGSEAPPVRLERHGAVAHLVLDRPDKLNAIGAETLRLLRAHTAAVEADPEIGAIVVRATGRAFCAGADLGEIGPLLEDPVAFDGFLDLWHDAYDALERCPLPVVAAVQDLALAGGFELLHVCDLVVLAEDARIGDQHATFGLYPAGGGTQRLARLVGRRRAAWLLMTGQQLSATAALEWGLATEVVPAADLHERAGELARLLAERSGDLTAELKRTLAAGAGLPLADALREERPHVLAHMSGAHARAGIAAFRGRTTPTYPPRSRALSAVPHDRPGEDVT